MICYASPTGTRRNLDALRRHDWGLLVGPDRHVWRNEPVEGFTHLAGDNGAWSCYQAGRAFDEDAYDRFLEWIAPQTDCLDWLVLPDIVAGGLRSLALSLRYLNRGLSIAPMVLIAVQDGMKFDDLAPHVGPNVGIFLGGSTRWKLATMLEWGAFCCARSIHYHVARVNTSRRMYLAIAAGADSIDGSSVSRYAINAPKLTSAARHRDLFSPRQTLEPRCSKRAEQNGTPDREFDALCVEFGAHNPKWREHTGNSPNQNVAKSNT